MEIKADYDASFGPLPELRLSLIPRWVIIDIKKKQSVAEHSINVAFIVKYLCDSLIEMTDDDYVNELMVDALYHDFDEIKTGDIPTPAKNKKEPSCLHPIVKLADLLESYRFANKYCMESDGVKRWILHDMFNKIKELSIKLDLDYTLVHPFVEGEM